MIKSNIPPTAIAHNYIAPLVRILVLAVFLVAAVQTSASAVSITNRTGYTIVGFYATHTENWGSNLLGGSSIRNSETFNVNLQSRGNVRYWNLRFVLSNGQKKHWYNFDSYNVSSFDVN